MSSHQLVPATQGITCHAWNADRTEFCCSPNNNEVIIFENCTAPMSEWREKYRLNEHDLTVSAVDWHPVTGMIVTCAHDRNAFVWTNTDGTWTPSLVILRIEYAAIDCKWTPDGRKFAVASAAKCVPVCHYDEENSWWVSKMINKPHRSTVLCLDWHPNSQLIATGSSDFKCRIFSAFVERVDERIDMGPLAGREPEPFAKMYLEYSANGWVNCVTWSPSGEILAFACHDSTVHFVDLVNAPEVAQTVWCSFLPLCKIKFVNEASIIAGGHDNNPALFSNSTGSWQFLEFADKKPAASAAASPAAATGGSNVSAARAMFQSKAKHGSSVKAPKVDNSWMNHSSPIVALEEVSPATFSSTAVDGRVAMWDLPALQVDHAALGL